MRSCRKVIRSVVVPMLFGLLPAVAVFAAPSFTLSSTPSVLEPGFVMPLDVNASALTDLYAYQLSVNYDPTLFRANAVTEGPFLASGGATFFDGGTIDNTAGEISFVLDTLLGPGPGVTGSGLLDAISFTVLRHGGGSISLSDVLALDSIGNVIAVTTPGLPLSTPEPGSVVLLSVGALAMLFGLMRRRGPSGGLSVT
jgi:Cohesin domain